MTVKSPVGLRLWILIGALLLVAGGVIHGLFSAWRLVQEVETKLTTSQIERFQLASEVRRELQSLNSSMLRYLLLRDPEQWKQFEHASQVLDQRLDGHNPSLNQHSLLTTAAERQAFQQLNSAFGDYLDSARAIHSNVQPALVSSGQVSDLDTFDAQTERMRELLRQLSEAHRAAQVAFLANASASLTSLRAILTAGVILLLALVAAMGWVIYRDTIAPLSRKLVQSQTLLERQEKLATLGTLAAGIAHEIRNPLTSLKARLYTLEKHLQDSPAAKKDTEIIGSEIARLERIVQAVLSFARPSEPCLERIEASALLAGVQGLMSQNLEKAKVRLVVEPGPNLFFRADSGHIKQVLVNLVRNAAEALEGPGIVTLRSQFARTFLAGRETDTVVLEVEDNGCGIPPEIEQRLFDPFFTTKETGTGLGLPIAARILEKHGGLLQYRTRPGQGTTFGVVLPLDNEETTDRARATENITHRG